MTSDREEDPAASVAAIREAIRDLEAGDRGRPAGDVLQELRDELGFLVSPGQDSLNPADVDL